MITVKEKVTALKDKMLSAKTKSTFVNKVIDSSKKYQLTDEFPFWQANNDKSPTNKPWGKES